jgi:hypothetical protein
MKKYFPYLIIGSVVLGICLAFVVFFLNDKQMSIYSFDDCVAAGNPMMESYPEQCRTKDGRLFVRPVNQAIELTGNTVCLPHKDTDGPQTLECAFGIESGNIYYGLKIVDQNNVNNFSIGTTLTVKGILNESESDNYAIAGTIAVDSISK